MSLFLGKYERHGAGLLLIQTENYDPISCIKGALLAGIHVNLIRDKNKSRSNGYHQQFLSLHSLPSEFLANSQSQPVQKASIDGCLHWQYHTCEIGICQSDYSHADWCCSTCQSWSCLQISCLR